MDKEVMKFLGKMMTTIKSLGETIETQKEQIIKLTVRIEMLEKKYEQKS